MSRLSVRKTYKLYIGGAFPRSESGRTFDAEGHNVARASRKDARDAVRAARLGATCVVGDDRVQPRPGALPTRRDDGGSRHRPRDASRAATRSNRRSIAPSGTPAGPTSSPRCIGSSNPVAGPYFDFTIPEPTGVVAILAPGEPPLLGLVSRMLPALVGGNTVVVVASRGASGRGSRARRGAGDLGLPGRRRQRPHRLRRRARALARRPHGRQRARLTGIEGDTAELEQAAAENVKRVVRSSADVAEPMGDRRLPRAEDRLAPDRALRTRSTARRVDRLSKARPDRLARQHPDDQRPASRVVHGDVIAEHPSRGRVRHPRCRHRLRREPLGRLHDCRRRRRFDELDVDARRARSA